MTDDWEASDHKLHKASVAAIKRFARENPGKAVCCFFFDCDEPRYGHLSISLDTPENNIRAVKRCFGVVIQQRSVPQARRKNAGLDGSWRADNRLEIIS